MIYLLKLKSQIKARFSALQYQTNATFIPAYIQHSHDEHDGYNSQNHQREFSEIPNTRQCLNVTIAKKYNKPSLSLGLWYNHYFPAFLLS
jgi:hypothetical protein